MNFLDEAEQTTAAIFDVSGVSESRDFDYFLQPFYGQSFETPHPGSSGSQTWVGLDSHEDYPPSVEMIESLTGFTPYLSQANLNDVHSDLGVGESPTIAGSSDPNLYQDAFRFPPYHPPTRIQAADSISWRVSEPLGDWSAPPNMTLSATPISPALPPPITNTHVVNPPSFGAIRSTKSSARFSQNHSLPRSSTSRSQTASVTTNHSSAVDAGEAALGPCISAFEDIGGLVTLWIKMMGNTPPYSKWTVVIETIDGCIHSFVQLSATLATMNSDFPNEHKIIRNVNAALSSQEIVRSVSHLGNQRVVDYDKSATCHEWLKKMPSARLSASNPLKIAWALENPYVDCLRGAATQLYASQVRATIRRGRVLSNNLVLNASTPHPASHLEPDRVAFRLIHKYDEGPALGITSLFGEAGSFVEYYGSVHFQTLVAEFMTPTMPYTSYATCNQHYSITIKLLALPAALLAAATQRLQSAGEGDAEAFVRSEEDRSTLTELEKTFLHMLTEGLHAAIVVAVDSKVITSNGFLHYRNITDTSERILAAACPHWVGHGQFIGTDESSSRVFHMKMARLLPGKEGPSGARSVDSIGLNFLSGV